MTDQVVLSIFPGIDLLGRAFEELRYCIVRGPDKLWGGDVRAFHVPRGKFAGVIGGCPCQDYSRLRRCPPTGEGDELLLQYLRVVSEAQPAWFLLENVPGVPDVEVDGYTVQRLDVRGGEVGLRQRRLRHFQFGYRSGGPLVLHRRRVTVEDQRACVASEGRRQRRRDWGDFCELMGLPRDFDLPGLSVEARYRAVGNGVPLPMGRLLAKAISTRCDSAAAMVCVCGCGRMVEGKQISAGPACRKRLERSRGQSRRRLSWRDSTGVTVPGPVTLKASRLFV